MSKVAEILEGWRNHLIPPSELKDFIEQTSKDRLNICVSCEFNSTQGKVKMFSKCNKCGCPLIQKSKSLRSQCPIDKWGPVATEDQEHEIKLATKNGEKSSE